MRTRTIVASVLFALLLVACGGDDTEGTSTTEAGQEETTTTAEAATTTTAPGTTSTGAVTTGTLTTAESDLGTILVDAEGRTVYIFMPDAQGTPTCTAECASNWPPLIGDATAGSGADQALVGTAEHPEVGEMITYNNWPLYHFAGDSAPGDTNGQGLQDIWFVVGADGEPITG